MPAKVDGLLWNVPSTGELAHQLCGVSRLNIQSCLDKQRETSERLGQLLVNDGALRAADLDRLLQYQVSWMAKRANVFAAGKLLPSATPVSICIANNSAEAHEWNALRKATTALRAWFEELELLVVSGGQVANSLQAPEMQEDSWTAPNGCERLDAIVHRASGEWIYVVQANHCEWLLQLPRVLLHAMQVDAVFGESWPCGDKSCKLGNGGVRDFLDFSTSKLRGQRRDFEVAMLPRWLIDQWHSRRIELQSLREAKSRLAKQAGAYCDLSIPVGLTTARRMHASCQRSSVYWRWLQRGRLFLQSNRVDLPRLARIESHGTDEMGGACVPSTAHEGGLDVEERPLV